MLCTIVFPAVSGGSNCPNNDLEHGPSEKDYRYQYGKVKPVRRSTFVIDLAYLINRSTRAWFTINDLQLSAPEEGI